ncbi:MAG: ribonuclease HI family protein [candidate division WOR-3 bacterium]
MPVAEGKISNELIVQIDGSSRYNPGPAGIGIRVVAPDGSVIKEISRSIGIKTNNQAEYEALIEALKEIRCFGIQQPVVIQTDSELLYQQINGKYRVRNQKLKLLHKQALLLLKCLPNVKITLVERGENRADRLAKRASGSMRDAK